MPGIGFSGVANGAFTTTGKASSIGGINSGSAAGAGVGGTGVISTFVTVPPFPTVIGEPYGGGFYAGQVSTTGTGVADYYLIVAPTSTGESAGQAKTNVTTTTGTDSTIDGPTNSLICFNTGLSPIATFCENLTIGGFSDWYWPALYELRIIYYNLKPTTTLNVINYGSNPYAVPPRVINYTTSDPAQTTATDFQTGGAQTMTSSYYWSSSQAFAGRSVWGNLCVNFSDGNQFNFRKDSVNSVRAIRRVPV